MANTQVKQEDLYGELFGENGDSSDGEFWNNLCGEGDLVWLGSFVAGTTFHNQTHTYIYVYITNAEIDPDTWMHPIYILIYVFIGVCVY